MRATHEHEFEAELGLPERLPADEQILWQGAPHWKSLGVQVFHLRSLGIYFALMLLLQASYLSGQSAEWSFKPLIISGFMVAMTLGSLCAWAWWSAKTTLYTITNKRVVMRIGVVYSLTFNLPLKKIVSAHELHRSQGTSDLSLTLQREDRIGWLHLWPHSRPWVINQPEPTLRCIADGASCAEILKSAWLESNKDIEVSVPNNNNNNASTRLSEPSSTAVNRLIAAT